MVRGLYTSALGMITQMQRMDVITNNIANVNTTGFKRDHVAAQSFSERLTKKIEDPAVLRLFQNIPIGRLNQGVFIDEVYTDFTSGTLRETGGALDVALVSRGFFCVSVNGAGGARELYTRDGSFSLGSDGLLVTRDGGRVLGQNGEIRLPNGEIAIDERGAITVNGEYIDTLRITDFEDARTLRKNGDNYYSTTADSRQAAFTGSVVQGFLENANVQTVKEMVELIALSRAYEANSKMIQTHDQTMGRAVNDIAGR
jgi:flagellar basal-body rod protein FlgG